MVAGISPSAELFLLVLVRLAAEAQVEAAAAEASHGLPKDTDATKLHRDRVE